MATSPDGSQRQFTGYVDKEVKARTLGHQYFMARHDSFQEANSSWLETTMQQESMLSAIKQLQERVKLAESRADVAQVQLNAILEETATIKHTVRHKKLSPNAEFKRKYGKVLTFALQAGRLAVFDIGIRYLSGSLRSENIIPSVQKFFGGVVAEARWYRAKVKLSGLPLQLLQWYFIVKCVISVTDENLTMLGRKATDWTSLMRAVRGAVPGKDGALASGMLMRVLMLWSMATLATMNHLKFRRW